MRYCENCGKKLLDNTKFCQFCGTKIITNFVESVANDESLSEHGENQTIASVSVEPEQVQIGAKKIFALSKKHLLMFAAVLIVLITLSVVVYKTISQNQYEKKLKETYQLITTGAESAENYTSLQSKVWYNSIYKQSSSETDKYTKDNYGSYYSDFNDALTSFYEGESFVSSAITSNIALVNNNISELKDYPGKFKDEYVALKNLYVAYSDLTDLAVGTSSYSYNTFSDALKNARTNYKSALSAAKLLLE